MQSGAGDLITSSCKQGITCLVATGGKEGRWPEAKTNIVLGGSQPRVQARMKVGVR